MRKNFEYYKSDYWSFGIFIQNQYEPDRTEKPYCVLHINLFNHSLWFKVPEFFKPKTYWVDTSNESWNKDKEKPCGYMETVRKQYGFTFTPDALHTYYGIQPGCWSSRDPENSDHTKLFWYPWQLVIVRHDLLFPDGSVYYRNKYTSERRKSFSWYEILHELDCPYPIYPKKERVSETVELEHYNKTDGKLQKATITLTGDEREWRPKCTKWLPIFRKISRVVDCDSDTELGTRSGSWKGGMMGWSTEWKEDESMKQAFRRWYKKWDGE